MRISDWSSDVCSSDLLRRADPLEHLHVPGVGRRAVQRLRSERVLAELDRYVRVVEVGEATDLGVGQEEVPEAGLLGLGLGAVEHLELTRREGPRVGPSLHEAEVLLQIGRASGREGGGPSVKISVGPGPLKK